MEILNSKLETRNKFKIRNSKFQFCFLVFSACLVFSISYLGFLAAFAQPADDPSPPVKMPQAQWGTHG
ncbi:MAG TPA: hypothetical protein VMT55_03150, partial [Candidatus Sulfotelmatobacter sp.]|nr:hypothetical protein [Candidatus Sulfotelmatobacter sp.]